MKPFDPVILIEHLRSEDLTDDRRGKGVKAGTLGHIVEVYNDGEGFAVEFFGRDMHTIGIGTVRAGQVRAATEQDLAARRIPA